MIERTLFNEEHALFRDTARRFMETEVQPHRERWEEQGYVDREVWLKAGAAGFLCPSMPEQYGGAGADRLYSTVLIEEQHRIGDSGLGFSLHSEIVAPYLLHYGSEHLKQTYLPKMASGEMIGAIAMTEPAAGSDLQGIKTTAVKQGDHWLLNGSKTFITNGWHSDLVIVVAKTDAAKGYKGISLFVVDTSMPGFSKGKRLKKLGMKAQDTAELFFDNVRVPASNLLGEEGSGFVYLMQELPWERMQIALGAVAAAEAALAWTGLPAHPLHPRRTEDRGPDRPRLRRPLHGAAVAGQARRRRRLDGEVLDHRPAVQGDRRLPAAARRLWLHVGIPDRARLRRRPRATHLRRHQRNHERDHLEDALTMTEAYIYDAVRTPRGKGRKDGALHGVTPIELAATALRAVRDRNALDTALVDDVVLGCVEPVAEQGADIARVAALYADYALTASGVTVSRFCASGLEACNQAAAQIMSGQSDLVVGGGVESMSRVPMFSSGGAWPTDPQVAAKTYFVPQGISADLIATKWGYSRQELDAYAAESQRRAKQAWDEGRFKKSIVPVKDVNGLTILDRDEYMRPETTLESLGQLKPAFAEQGEQYGFDSVILQRYPEVERVNHVHHAGNSSGIVDGAAAVLFGTKEMGQKLGLKPRARIRAFASTGSEPSIMLTGPAPATEKALKRAGMSVKDIDLYELNEAFAAVVVHYMRLLGISHDRMNVNGGSIAMGHPLGATGAMILGTLLDELERRNLATGLATLCVGAGMGTATIIERI